VGRFAPSPTGPLHFGSLVAAVASWLDARRHGGRWLLRMEDLDPPREVPGAADAILRSLEAFGLHWDGPVLYQSTRHEAYREALAKLRASGMTYDCGCTRREVGKRGRPGLDGPVYPGTCRNGLPPGKRPRAVRVRTGPGVIGFADRMQGSIRQDLAREVGDFIICRADGLYAYQLAVVVDDAHQGITHVVRGADLLDSTPRQILLQRLLGLSTPAYLHHPLVLTPGGEKLSKQTHAPPVDDSDPVPALLRALRFLGETVPEHGEDGSVEEVLGRALLK
jgi:glutamyl-Q tRNA(Asp) synthetase